ncbi:MAG: putative sugar nucleotidyl transferase [Nocardioides sp.]
MTALVLFEDEGVDRFLPLVWTRPVFDLRCGIHTLREAVEAAYGRPVDAAVVRPFLAESVARTTSIDLPYDGMVLMVNGRVLADPTLADVITLDGGPELFRTPDGVLVAARLAARDATPLDLPPAGTLQTIVDWPMLANLWDIVAHCYPRIITQAEAFTARVSASATVGAGVVIDESDGPVIIDDDAQVMALAFIQGPAYVGKGTIVKAGARILHGTSLGPQCRVGGEVEASVFLGHANKQHDGFLGHSVIGQWCNLGAGTTNSDLKNNYSTVRVGGEDTGQMLVGLFMGDHAKAGINTSFNTGAVVGVAANVFGAALAPKDIGSFSWGDDQVHRLEEAIATARVVCARRGVEFAGADESVLRHVFERTVGGSGGDGTT